MMPTRFDPTPPRLRAPETTQTWRRDLSVPRSLVGLWHAPCLTPQQGVTLIELMVAMTIGLFLTAGVISLYLGMSNTFRATQGQSEVSENGRFALEMIAQDVRHAGFDPTQPPEEPWIDDYIFGWESTIPSMTHDGGTWTANTNTWKAGTDSIRLTHAAPEVGCNPAVPGSCHPCPGRSHYIYSIGPDSDGNNLGLRRTRIGPRRSDCAITTDSQPLIAGIIDMQIRYATGERIDNFSRPRLTSQYRLANELTAQDWQNVFAVKISLLVKSDNTNVMEQPMTMNFDGASWTAPDNALYRQFHGYATVRNRLP